VTGDRPGPGRADRARARRPLGAHVARLVRQGMCNYESLERARTLVHEGMCNYETLERARTLVHEGMCNYQAPGAEPGPLQGMCADRQLPPGVRAQVLGPSCRCRFYEAKHKHTTDTGRGLRWEPAK
jgi:hypothetical protein